MAVIQAAACASAQLARFVQPTSGEWRANGWRAMCEENARRLTTTSRKPRAAFPLCSWADCAAVKGVQSSTSDQLLREPLETLLQRCSTAALNGWRLPLTCGIRCGMCSTLRGSVPQPPWAPLPPFRVHGSVGAPGAQWRAVGCELRRCCYAATRYAALLIFNSPRRRPNDVQLN